MSLTGLPLLLLLFLAHILGDFVFQKLEWIDERYEKHCSSKLLYFHSAIHGFLALTILLMLLTPSWELLGFAAIIGATHFSIDLAKSYTSPGRLCWFVIDQLLHLTVIGLVWLRVSNQWEILDHTTEFVLDEKTLLILAAYLVVIWPFSVVIGLVCNLWANEIEDSGSLANAGKRIGQLERFLILTFILVEQFAAIGFLLAAKSVLRYGDSSEKNHRKINEYILVGTMTSFSITIAFGLIVKLLMVTLQRS